MKKIKLLLLTVLVSVCGTYAQDCNMYLEKAKEHLKNGNYDAAQISYQIYMDVTGNTDTQIEYALENRPGNTGAPGYETIDYPDGARYKGYILNGKLHGQGTFYFASGNTYEGEWKNNKQHGKGKFYWITGDSYEGDFKNGLQHGKGTYYHANGDVYKGEWEKGMKHGYGATNFADGDKFEGFYLNDRHHGQGTYYCANGDIYSGEWINGALQGNGTFYSKASDTLYNVIWKDSAVKEIIK